MFRIPLAILEEERKHKSSLHSQIQSTVWRFASVSMYRNAVKMYVLQRKKENNKQQMSTPATGMD